jgi:hypothetical protein
MANRPSAKRVYSSAEHQRNRRELLGPDARCWRCGGLATEIDHVPPLAVHEHEAGSGCCSPAPACKPCNARAGAILGNRLRARRRRRPPFVARARRSWEEW